MSVQIPNQPRVLIVGGGAREHAIAWKLQECSYRPQLFAAPGNAGIAELATCVDIKAEDVEGIVEFASAHAIQLVVVGPEVPLARGLADMCMERGIRVFGPSRAAAQIESSKAFAKDLMTQAGVPTASFQAFSNPLEAKRYISAKGTPLVIKADGLAAGKGVVVAATIEEAHAAIDEMMVQSKFGDSGRQVIIEDFLVGEEISMMFFVDGSGFVSMASARDYKRVGEGNTGLNTGGMGAFAPVPGWTELDTREVADRIVQPLLAELRRREVVYRGVLYAGLMMTDQGPYVIEFNARFGDPETEVVLPLLSSDLLEVMWAVAEDKLCEIPVEWNKQSAACVVLAAPGYPEHPRTGSEIFIRSNEAGAHGSSAETQARRRYVFHAGTRRDEVRSNGARPGEIRTDEVRTDGNGTLRTAGGRVLVCGGMAGSLAEAREIAYENIQEIYFEGMYYRRDIAE